MLKVKAKALLLSLVLLLSVGLAEDLGGESADGALPGVIIATDANYPDAIVSGAAAEYMGLSILLTEKEALSDDIKAFLDEEKPDEIILIGGEAVISAAIEEELVTDGFEVTRLWGATRYGTSAEIAKYFFSEGVDEAVVVSDVLGNNEGNEVELLAVAKSLAAKDYLPVLLTGNDVLAAEVASALTDLGVAKVYLIGKAFDANVTEELKALNIEVELISGEDTEEVTKKVEEKVVDELIKEGVTRLLVLAPGVDFKNVIALPAMPEKAAAKIIKDESQIPDLVAFIIEKGIKEVKVVGKPEMVSKIAAQLLLTEGIRVDAMSAKDIGRKLVESAKAMKNEWAEKREKFKEKAAERLAKNKDKLDARLAEALEEAEAFLMDLGAQLEELEATAETEEEIAAIEDALKRYEAAEAIIAKANEAQAAGKLDLALKTLRKAHNDAKNARWGAIKKFYAGDKDLARQKIDELLDEERAGMDRFANGIMKEFEHFKGFMEEAQSAGFIADECAALIADAEGMADDVLSEFDGVDYRRARIIASKTKHKLSKCMTATRVNAKKDAAKGKLFAAAFEAKNLAEGFEDRMGMCEDRCDEEFDRCLDFIGGCEERCSADAAECEDGAADILARCAEVGDQDLSAVVDECLSSCDFILEDTEDAEASEAEYGLCLDECGAIQEEAEASIENCEAEAEKFLDKCEAKIDDCNNFCQQSSEEKCQTGVEQCVPKCLGKRFFRPGLTDNICAAKCKFARDKKGCLDKCEDESLEEGQQHENKRKCEGEAFKVANKCFDGCERKCANTKDVCITRERCKVTREGDEITRECKKVEECKPELCFARCEEGCKKAAMAYTYKCAAKRPKIKFNFGGCQEECAEYKRSPFKHMQCMEKCRIKTVAKHVVPPKHMKKCQDKCKGEKNKAKCMTKCIAPPGIAKRLERPGNRFDMQLARAECAMDCANKLNIDINTAARKFTGQAGKYGGEQPPKERPPKEQPPKEQPPREQPREGIAPKIPPECLNPARPAFRTPKCRDLRERALANRPGQGGPGDEPRPALFGASGAAREGAREFRQGMDLAKAAVQMAGEMRGGAAKMNICIRKCVEHKRDAWMKNNKPTGPIGPTEPELDKCQADDDCGGLECPMAIGMDTPMCFDGECVCSGYGDEDFPEEEFIPEEECDALCGDIDDPEEQYICISSCKGDDIDFIELDDDVEYLFDDAEELIDEELEQEFADEAEDLLDEAGDYFDESGEVFDEFGELGCVVDEDCLEGELCFDGICEYVGGDDLGDEYIDEGYEAECQADDDCGEGFYCEEEFCIPLTDDSIGEEDLSEYGYTAECELDEDCSTDEYCEASYCVYKELEPTPEPTTEPSLGECELLVDGEMCNNGAGACAQGECVDIIEDIAECELLQDGEPCNDGTGACTEGECVDIIEDNAKCQVDDDCETDQYCEDGDCVYKAPDPTLDPSECQADDDCDEGFYCEDGDCLYKAPDPTLDPSECQADDDCDEGLYCEDGDCVYKAPEGEGEKTCDDGFVYDDDLDMCVPEQIDMDKECDPPCGDGEKCEAGYCVLTF